jgi:Molybdopterin oxidoreductase Fe4S4 domain
MAIQQMHTYCAMCVSRCGVLATVEDGRLTKVTADPEHPNGCICVKRTAAPEIVHTPDRLQYPMMRTRPKGDPDPGWARISLSRSTSGALRPCSRLCTSRCHRLWLLSHSTPRATIPIQTRYPVGQQLSTTAF